MHNPGTEEGDVCGRDGCIGVIELPEVRGCSCHINPPCSACVENMVQCPECGWEDEYDPPPIGKNVQPYIQPKPRPLDPTKIDWRPEGHTRLSMIKRGVYPEGTTQEEVRKVVDGTFGGRFETFSNGRFTFIAYTD